MEGRKRARRGTGTARQKPDGRWEYRVPVAGHRRSFMGKTLGEAQHRAAEAKRAAAREIIDSQLLGRWLMEWLEQGRARLKPQTWLAYELHTRLYLIPAIGDVRIDQLCADDIDRLHEYAATRVGPTTANHIHLTLSAALTVAVRRRLTTRNVAKEVSPPRRAPASITPLLREEVDALVAACAGDPLEALYLLAVMLGVRQGELLGLRWSQVDLAHRRIRISGNATRTLEGGSTVSTPKTLAGSRNLAPLPMAIVDALERTPRLGELVWPDPKTGRPILASSFARIWHRMRDKAGLPPLKFHDLRHTAATHLLDEGVPAHVVALLLGHATVGTTLRVYAHVTQRGLGAAMDAVSARYPGQQGT